MTASEPPGVLRTLHSKSLSVQAPESGFTKRPTSLNPDPLAFSPTLGPQPPIPRGRVVSARPLPGFPGLAPSAVSERPLAYPDGTSQSHEATRGPDRLEGLGSP